MKAREFNARRLDVRALAKAAVSLDGSWPLAGFDRLVGSLASQTTLDGQVTWMARGFEVAVRGGAAQTWLELQARACVPLVCQRCLQQLDEILELDRRFLFVANEAAAALLDGELEDDVLVFTKELDLHELVEDELLLGLPLVPRHDVCPHPLSAPVDGVGVAEQPDEPPHPFAALAALRKGDA